MTRVVAAVLLGLLVPGEGGGEAPPPPGPDAAMQRVRITEMRKGERLWDVEADKAEVFEDRGLAVLTQISQPVRIVIYNGKETLVSYAKKAVVNLKTNDLELIGQVRSESSLGTRLFAETLNWSAESRQVSTDVPVVVEKEGFRIQGKGMVADTILDRMTIRERIASQVRLPERREPHP